MCIEPIIRRRGYTTVLLLLTAAFWGAPALGQACDAFTLVPSPNPDPDRSVLSRVAGTSSTDAWALGTMGDPSVPLLIYWNGSEWAPRPVPSLPSGTVLTALGATPDGDTWLGGQGQRPLPGIRGNPVLARARGGAFGRVDEVALPPQTTYPHWPRGGNPMAIDGTSASDVWVALEADGNGDATGTTISSVLHFDGSGWTETILPRRANFRSHPRGIEAISPSDVWVAGYGRSVGTAFFGELFHFNGSSWSYVPTPLEDVGQVFFEDVSASGPDDVWVVGYVNYTDPIYLHYDGSGWTVVPGPASAAPVRVVALSPDNAWASPYSLHDSNAYFHWDGTAWTEVAGPAIPGATAVRRGTDLAKVGPCEAWSVGWYAAGTPVRTLTERLGGGAASCAQSLTATLDDPTPAPGDVVTFTVTVTNNDAAPAPLDLWLDAVGPVSRTIRLGSGTLPAGATVTRPVRLRIPGNAPGGHYALALNVGTFPGEVCDAVGFTLDVQAARGGGGSVFEVLTPGGDFFAAAALIEPGVNVAPNPFTRQATITLEVAAAQHVRAEVFDALGRRVAVLADGGVEAGAHALVFDGAGLPSGVYVVRVTGEAFAATRRVTLAR